MRKQIKSFCNKIAHFIYNLAYPLVKKTEDKLDFPKIETKNEIANEEELAEICIKNMQEKIKSKTIDSSLEKEEKMPVNSAEPLKNTRHNSVKSKGKITYIFSTKEREILYKGSKFRKFIKANQELYPFKYRALYRFAIRHEGKEPRLFSRKYYVEIIRSIK